MTYGLKGEKFMKKIKFALIITISVLLLASCNYDIKNNNTEEIESTEKPILIADDQNMEVGYD